MFQFPESAGPADKPNFTGTAPSTSAAAASDTEAETESSVTDSPAEETTTEAAAAKDENDADKDAEGGGENKIIPVEALDSLWVPALCDNQAGNLEGGQLPQHLKTGMLFDVAAAGLKLNQDDTPKGAYADINGDGRDEAVITYVCNKGGTGWPDNLLIYDNDLNYITKVDDWEREECHQRVGISSSCSGPRTRSPLPGVPMLMMTRPAAPPKNSPET